MSPRRKIESTDIDLFDTPASKLRRRWGLPIVALASALLIAAAITVGALVLYAHESEHRDTVKQAQALDYVRSFMTGFTSPDPFHANDYADRVLAGGTGDFAKAFKDQMNQIVVQVASAQPATGSVLEAGVEKWNDDGSADVLVATEITTTTPDGKSVIETGNRWLATATKEGQQWKISQLSRVV